MSEHIHHLEWDGDGWGCTCGFWIERVGSDVENALNEWAGQKARIAALEVLCRSALPTVKHAYLTKHCPSEHEWLKRYIDLLGAGREKACCE